MKRTYLEEDLALIQKYFPGAQPITLRTPFDLTLNQDRLALGADTFRDEPKSHWFGDLLWNRSI